MSIPLESEIFIDTAGTVGGASGSKVGPASAAFVSWLVSKDIPSELIDLFSKCAPKEELWAGAGALFDESSIMRWNDDFPESLQNGLLILGSAPNGDHICIDLLNGEVGYVCHEKEWRVDPRGCFASVSKTLGSFIRDINSESAMIPEDYWEAIA